VNFADIDERDNDILAAVSIYN